MEKCNHISSSDRVHFSVHTQEYTEFQNFRGLYFPHFTIFATKPYNFTKFRMLFAGVLVNIRNSNVGHAIVSQKEKFQLLLCILIF